jgi:DNA-binding transcriptional LysR family regulator
MRKTSDLNDIRTFEAVAKAGSVTGAARDLALPASTVSRSLTRLEEHLGILLVRRTQRGLTLTEAGSRYLVSCKNALRALREGAQQMEAQRTHPSGVLRIAAPVCFAKNTLTPLLSPFLTKYQELRVEVDLYSSGWDKEPEDEVDVYFKVRAPKDSAKRCRLYPDILQGIFASPRYLARHGTPDEPAALRSHRCIGLLPEGGFDLWRLSKDKSRVTPEMDLVTMVSDPEVHRQLVLDGAGIAVLPLWLATQPGVASKLTRLMPAWKPPSITLSALYSGSSRLTPKIELFLNYIEPYIGTDRDPCLHGAQAKVCFARSRSKARKN